MHYSGIVVTSDPLAIDDCRRALERLPGVEVHYCEPESGRLVVVQETASAEDQELGLRRIQGLPLVRVAALVEHRIDLGDPARRGPDLEDPNLEGPDPEDPGSEGKLEGGTTWS